MGRTVKTGAAEKFGHDELPEFAKGQDVGHGVDHDCAQCRSARRDLKLAGLGDAGIPDHTTKAADRAQEITDSTASELAAIGSGASQPVVETLSDASPGSIEQGRDFNREAAERQDRIDALDAALNEAVEQALRKAGVRDFEINFYEDEIMLLDSLMEARPSLAVMLMKGYVPDDNRWHCEMMVGGSRAHIIYAERAIAIKLCVLSLVDGQKGMTFERQYAALNPPNQRATHFTGIEQANVL